MEAIGTVTLPYERVKTLAEHLGSQDRDVCPPHSIETGCWLRRNLVPYIPAENEADVECVNCWMEYILGGN
jgi:hypothetical protein